MTAAVSRFPVLPSPLSLVCHILQLKRQGSSEQLLSFAYDYHTFPFRFGRVAYTVYISLHLWTVVGNAALPEVVFVGRSNVGKSSLVNMLVNRKTLAPTSAVPGFTQVRSVFFFLEKQKHQCVPDGADRPGALVGT